MKMEEAGLMGIMPIIIIVLIGIYYGMGRNIEVASGMLTRELEDAERLQKERIVKKYNAKGKDEISDAAFAKAVAAINRIDDLDI
jgi:uncharacterized membrane protein